MFSQFALKSDEDARTQERLGRDSEHKLHHRHLLERMQPHRLRCCPNPNRCPSYPNQIEPFSFADEPLEFYGQEPTRDIALALCRASGILFMESGELPI
jgi:hypothetical protein